MQKRVWAILLTAALLGPQTAYADQTSFGLQLAGTHGTHRESDGSATAPLIPAPILTASHRMGCFEVAAQGLPPIGPIHIANNGLGMQDIALTYVDASLRYWNKTGTLGIGVGETLYNQRTNFARALDASHRGTELDRSRVAGTRYEIAGRLPLGTRDEVRATLGVDPAMHGRYSYMLDVRSGSTGFNYASSSRWERASQVDADARFVHHAGDYALSYGIRYLNYTAAYTGWPPQHFADANSLLMPYVGVERFFGSSSPAAHDSHAPCLSRKSLPRIEAFIGGQIAAASHRARITPSGDARSAMPLFGLRARRGPYELFAEGTPAVRGFASAGARYWLRGGLGLGVGDALYTSHSRAAHQVEFAVRAAGLRYELLQSVPLPRGGRLLLDAAVSPGMHQRSTAWVDGFRGSSSPLFGTGSLVDASASFETPQREGHTWVYGLRYLNYTGGMQTRFDPLKERTGLFTAFAAWGFTLGGQ